jgi:integrase/recombinase XerD
LKSLKKEKAIRCRIGMPRRSAFKRLAEDYLAECEKRRLSRRTIEGYAYTLKRTEKALERARLRTHPKHIGENEMDEILREFNNSHWYMKTLNVFLNWNGNDIMKQMQLKWPKRPLKADWLTPEEAEVFYATFMSMPPPYKTLGHLELCLGFRRSSCMKALRTDFRTNQVIVHGKGRMGGKDYTIFPHPETRQVVEEAIDHNNHLVRRAGASSQAERQYLFLYTKGKRLGHYSGDTSYDTLLSRICKEAEVYCSHHTLRRTFGRTLWEAGVPIETISEMMGHEKLDVTRQYLGIKLDDMRTAWQLLEAHRNRKKQKVYLSPPSQT